MERYSQFAYDNERNIRQRQDEVSRKVKIAIAETMPQATRGRTAGPNPMDPTAAKMIEDGKPRHILADSEDELKQVVNALRRAFAVRNLALKVRKDEKNALGIFVHFGPIVKRAPRQPKAAATENAAGYPPAYR